MKEKSNQRYNKKNQRNSPESEMIITEVCKAAPVNGNILQKIVCGTEYKYKFVDFRIFKYKKYNYNTLTNQKLGKLNCPKDLTK